MVTFDGVSKDRIEEMKRDMNSGERPEGLDATEFIVLHDPEAEKSQVILFFEDEDAYRRGDEILNTLPAGDPPGQRTSVRSFAAPSRSLALNQRCLRR